MTVMPSSQSVEVTHNATFTTMITGVGSNNFTYQWKHNGTIISGELNTLMITNVMESNSGIISIVTNQFGDTNTSNVVVLMVTVSNIEGQYNAMNVVIFRNTSPV